MRTLFLHFGIVCLLLPVAVAQTPSPPAKVSRYALIMIQRLDKNGDGILQREEWQNLPGAPRAIDMDGDQQISLDELVRYFTQYGQGRTIHRTVAIDLSEPYRFDPANLQTFRPFRPRVDVPSAPSAETQESTENALEEMLSANEQPIDDDAYQRLLEERQIPAARPYHVPPETLRGVPRWFVLLDRDGDGQISLAEFAPTLAPSMVNRFKQLDKNGNGLIEPNEARNP